jgi:hypothetical protein
LPDIGKVGAVAEQAAIIGEIAGFVDGRQLACRGEGDDLLSMSPERPIRYDDEPFSTAGNRGFKRGIDPIRALDFDWTKPYAQGARRLFSDAEIR